ncbi:acyltransferase family protein [Flavihumibacter profundi]|jgi:glucans biosynthesis protein C|uniref:acyltransferase family protein n=1 Tax=Flavihumibacter profundi TaxID=2716883 RepID=UPI001CC64FFC|nr:acyltransferase family protein [Flavihumibacter profundi]MBZ5857427.1 acyltransferase family protein [Flavihumibacter profundi]
MVTQRDRQHYIDWIRVLAFILLIIFHSSMPFVPYGWEVKNAQTSQALMNLIWWFHQWRLPLLFFISGVGVYFSLQRRPVPVFLWERVKRLFIPLVFAMLFTIPLQVWVEYTQKGRIHESYIDFYPSVWKFIPYPDGSLTWSHMWFVVYLFTFILILTPIFFLFKIKLLANFKEKITGLLASPVGTVLMVIPLMYIYYTLFLAWPEQGSLFDDWFVFIFSITLLLYGYFLGGSLSFWSNCEKYRKPYLLVAVITVASLYAMYWWPLQIPKEYGPKYTSYALLNCLEIWMVILAISGYAKKYLNFSSPVLTYLNRAVYPFYILHQTVIVVIGYQVVQWSLPLLVKLIVLTILSAITIFSIYHFIIRRTRLTRFLYGVKD